MRILLVFIFSFAAYFSFGQATVSKVDTLTKKKEIIGYFFNLHYDHFNKKNLLTPFNADFSKYTIINYFYMSPDEFGNIIHHEYLRINDYNLPDIDEILLGGVIDDQYTYNVNYPVYVPYINMVDHCHRVGTKIVLSIGEKTPHIFPKVAADPAKRAHFAAECKRVCKRWNLDGIDILNWVNPTNTSSVNSSNTDNFDLLLQTVRDSLTSLEKEINRHYLLTGAFSGDKKVLSLINWKSVNKQLDYINLFSINSVQSVSTFSLHNSPLYPYQCSSPGASIHESLSKLTSILGIPREKIIMGISFNGSTTTGFPDRNVNLCEHHSNQPDYETFATGSNENTAAYIVEQGAPSYSRILKAMQQFERKWDNDAKVPYLTGKRVNTLCSYDDLLSVQIKAEYVIKEKLAGCLITNINSDWVENPLIPGEILDTPLIDAINEIFFIKNDFVRNNTYIR